jgi:zona occludens toxin
MATKIFHGPPGSYKSSTVCWFELLEALKAGRLVVTNLQGIKTIEEISVELNIVFPASARLVRISSNNDVGRLLMRCFYHWLPIGAFIFIDEIQDIYPNDRSFKALDYDYKKEGFHDENLPTDVIDLYHERQREIKANINIEDFQDDIGLSIFDDRDYIKYPPTLREAFMRHRHFNWDIVLATPDIKEVAGFIRSVCEIAYAHSSKDSVPIPYFKRRPRVLEHLPSSNGISVKKGDITTFRKIPLDVFKIYKSTATGQSTKSGASQSPVTFTLLFAAAAFIALVSFIVYVLFFRTGSAASSQPIDKVQSVQISNGQNKNIAQVNIKGIQKGVSANNRHVSSSDVFAVPDTLIMPFDAQSIYLTAVNKTFIPTSYNVVNGKVSKTTKITYSFLFVLSIDNEEFYVSGDDLADMGYTLDYKTDSIVQLSDDNGVKFVPFAPVKYADVESVDDKQGLEVGL